MRFLLLFILSLFLGYSLVYYNFKKNPQNTSISFDLATPTPVRFEFSNDNPPKNSLPGEIASPSGEILWQSRTATRAADLGNTAQISQGESLITKSGSEVTVIFPGPIELKLFSDTRLDFIQTLPQNLVIHQKSGRVVYQPAGVVPLSVRSLNLLTDIKSGRHTYTVDENTKIIYLDIHTGSAVLGFNDLNYQTRVQTISAPVRVIYNDNIRTIRFIPIPPAD